MELTLNMRLLKTLAVALVALIVGIGLGRWWESGRAGETVEYVTPETQAVIETALTEISAPVSPDDLSEGVYTDRFRSWWQMAYRLYEDTGKKKWVPMPERFGKARVVRHNADGSRVVIVFAQTDAGKTRAYLLNMVQGEQGQWLADWLISAEDVVEE